MQGIILSVFDKELVITLILIYFFRIIEVSIGTVRIILIQKGYRKIGAILAFFEVLIWVFVASRVIDGLTEEPIKGVVYSLGFASGVYLGSLIENRLAFGKVLIQAITSEDLGENIATILRADGLGVTTINGEGKEAHKIVLMVYANRKGKEGIIAKIKSIDEKAMVVSTDVSTLEGGYISNRRRFVK